ncbi:MAG: prepilin-type N-terminal cleavage/methylation domain-containing protein [Planctomycetota bacterium]
MKRRHGLTLIELLAALILASVMTVALLRIVTQVASETRQLRRDQADYVAAGIVADRLREDLINARAIQIGRGSISLLGFPGDEKLFATVSYETRRIGATRLLLRREGERIERMWFGLGDLAIESLEFDDEESRPANIGGMPPIAALLRMTLTDATGRVLFSEVIRHHAN